MSRHHNFQIWIDIQHMSVAELEEQYGIQVDEDGSVWDPLENRSFNTLNEWATYMDDLEDEENCGDRLPMNKKQRFDDE